ncbi:DUF72 domain-containing protein [Myxacorys almedinensis]|uniref:DUF72 domain-containing protein n=1 Tax=Myxacorys almedinensis A TaxID=2690445 RepID=A0A8J8CIX6_9CYAN|nr:DUF72 domain-containing protein [Myxacorys almedinensis]NDJ18064.1 DUF72 domain-containing protein [Myxacorys almedinensis A]
MTFRIGCAIWAYKGWVGELFPAKSRPKDFLRLYSQRFTCVEGNTTFYSIPSAEAVARWAAETPSEFKFCPKLPRTITHYGLLKSSLSEALRFLELMQGLSDRLGVLMLQLPPSFSPANLENLSTFLAGWATTRAPLAVEVRHLEWFKEPHKSRLNALLDAVNVGRVLLDTRPIYECEDEPQIGSNRKKPNVPLQPTVTANTAIVRYISHPNLDFNEQYLREWVERIDRYLQQNIEVYFFVHCPIEARSPHIARYVQQQLEARGAPVPPLPWNGISTEHSAEEPPQPSQLRLF